MRGLTFDGHCTQSAIYFYYSTGLAPAIMLDGKVANPASALSVAGELSRLVSSRYPNKFTLGLGPVHFSTQIL
jgi:hypothetical protein